MTRKTGEEVIIVGMKSGEAYNGRKALWLNYDRERNRHRLKVFVNNGLDDEILLAKEKTSRAIRSSSKCTRNTIRRINVRECRRWTKF